MVNRWRARANEHDSGAFNRILTAYGIDEHTLERVVGIRPQDIPQWSIFDLIPAVDLAKNPPEWTRNSSFARVCDPLIRPFLVKFHSIAADMCDRYSHILRDDSERIFKLFASSLESRLHMLVRKACVLELNVARLRKRLHGETPEARFEDFVRMLGTEAYQFEFLSEYAVVAWHAISMAGQWLRNATNLLSRLCTDFPAYKAAIFKGEDPGAIESISWGAGDLHHGGQSVCIVTWSAGRKLVYKPNSLAISRSFAQFLEYINGYPLGPHLRYPNVFDLGDYGWAKFVPHEECGNREEVRRFYWRQGVFAAIFHLLNTRDLHHGNLIASGEYPIYIDCETLVQPTPEGSAGKLWALALAPQLASSLDLLPRRIWGGRECSGVDLSGLGGTPGQILPYAILKADAPKTDQMHIVKGDLVTGVKQNLPRLGSDLVTLTEEYKPAVREGFEAGYTVLLESREKLWDYIKSFNNVPVRLVLRPTRLYAVLQDASYHPDYMRNAMEQELLLSSTLTYDKGVTSIQITAELHDMNGDDIPYFLVRFSSHEVLDTRGRVIGKVVASCKETVLRNWGNLSRRARMQQSELIRATLGIESGQIRAKDGESVAMRNGGNACSTAIDRAKSAFTPSVFHHRMVRQLMVNSLHTEGRWLWATPNLIGMKNPDLTFSVSVPWLYGGLVGIGLYFMTLNAVIGGAQYKRIFENILQSVLDWHTASTESQMGCGLFDGRSGIGLFMLAAGNYANDNSLVEKGYRELLHASANYAEDTKWDVISGLSGHILALANVYALLGSTELLKAIRKAATSLLQRAVEVNAGIAWIDIDFSNNLPLAGFAHGAAGASAALAMAGKLCSCEAFVDGAWQAVAYENTQYAENARNWRDNRTFDKGVDQGNDTDINGWCHGAAGIGLARSFLVPVSRSSIEEGYLRRDIERVKGSTFVRRSSDCLCHGTLGNLACAQRAARAVNDQGWLNDLNALVARDLDNLFEREPVTGYGGKRLRKLYPQNPSLMCGVSGIGLASLCLLQPEGVGLILAGEMINPSKCQGGFCPIRSDKRSATPVSVPA